MTVSERVEELETSGQTAIVAAVDDRVVGVIGIADVVRPKPATPSKICAAKASNGS